MNSLRRGSLKFKISVASLIVLSLTFGMTLYRTPLKTLTILAPLLVLSFLILGNGKSNFAPFQKVTSVFWSGMIILMAVLWMPLTPVIGQNPTSPYSDNFFVYTALNFLPFFFCVGTFVYSISVYAHNDFKYSRFPSFLLRFMIVVLAAFHMSVNRVVFVSFVNGNWFSMLFFQVYVIRLRVIKASRLSIFDVLLGIFLAALTWIVLESRTIFAAYFIFLATYLYLSLFQKKTVASCAIDGFRAERIVRSCINTCSPCK